MKSEVWAIIALLLLFGGLPLLMAHLLNRNRSKHEAEYEYIPETDADAWARPNRDCVLCKQLVAHTKHVRERKAA